MPTVTSKDGTTIGYSATGTGPALVLVDGALCSRAMGPAADFTAQLADTFTVHSYDRRGRGESGDTAPYAVDREIDDLRAVIEAAGGSAYVFAQSSGAALALAAAHAGVPMRRLVTFEAPFVVDDSRDPYPADIAARLRAAVDAGRPGDAVATFMRLVGVPRVALALMRLTPVWRKLTAAAPTLPYDFTVLGDAGSGRPLPLDAYAAVTVPTLVLAGAKSPVTMRTANRQIADRVPGARYAEVPGATHMLKARQVKAQLTEFLAER
ncbi:alpha/beta fold hydrolase [Spirilliplanes yamanashiensis]|uniref:Alpha/beta hydrolase n=1 Tax=Spirilliplanes yamanashiensis TaxID=42233 RepID=A0A8J3Y9Y1_9ACTN|nr:alpha/beta hydrolase [Spirilliplanes yamanashiensis]MDP9817901.1 pimeloyl-ACP methyl ester carboxylesterase [Spirilliplanes yamanashiensis]GIJ04711.1 alpha/beta hydrolase [Spirilliplanes yamanashiensis]